MTNRKNLLILGLILMLGAALRFYNLNTKNLWYDETSSIANAMKGFGFVLQPIYNYKPLYIFLLKAWIGLFGCAAFVVRLPSVLFGIGSIFLVFKLGEELAVSQVGLISSFLLSTSCFHIYHSQQARHYSLLFFLSLLSFYYFIMIFKNGYLKYIVMTLLVNILILFMHPYGFAVILCQFLYNMIFGWKAIEKYTFKKWIFSQLLLLLGVIVLLCIIIFSKQHLDAILWWANPPDISNLVETFKTFCYGGPRYGLQDININLPIAVTLLLSVIFGVLFLRGLRVLIKDKTFLNVAGIVNLLNLWLFLPIALAFLFSYIYFPVYFIKHFLICLFPFYLIVAVGLHYKNKLFLKITVLAIIFLLNSFPLRAMYQNNSGVDWGKAVSSMKQMGIKDDAVIIISTCKEIIPFMYYFADADKKVFKSIDMFGKFSDDSWQEAFKYKRHYIVTIASEMILENDKCYITGKNGSNVQYNSEAIFADFSKKVSQKDILTSDQQIWLLMSKWSGEEYNLQAIANMMDRISTVKFQDEVGGIKIFCFEL